jgi:transcriptional regulator of heat shock response
MNPIKLTEDYLAAASVVKKLKESVKQTAQAMLDELFELEGTYRAQKGMSPFLFHYPPQVDWVEIMDNNIWVVRYYAGYGTEAISMDIANYVQQHKANLDIKSRSAETTEMKELRMLAELKEKYEPLAQQLAAAITEVWRGVKQVDPIVVDGKVYVLGRLRADAEVDTLKDVFERELQSRAEYLE